MKFRIPTILLINKRERTTKELIRKKYLIKDDSIRDYIKWFNVNYGDRIQYDKYGYFIYPKLNRDELSRLIGSESFIQNIESIFIIILQSMNHDFKIKNRYEIKDTVYYKITINNFLEHIKLPSLETIVSYSNKYKMYYLSILPLYYLADNQEPDDIYYENLFEYHKIYDDKFKKTLVKEVNNEVSNLIHRIGKNIFSNHSVVCFKLYFLLSRIKNNNRTTKIYVHSLYETDFVLPGYIDKEIFNSLMLLETDFLFYKIQFKNTKDIITDLDKIEILNITKGYITPACDELPYMSPYIVYSFYPKKINVSDYIYEKIIYIIISKYILNIKVEIQYNPKKITYRPTDYELMYSSFFGQYNIYFKESDEDKIMKYENDLYISFRNIANLKKISNMYTFNGLQTLSLKKFNLHLHKSLPKMYNSILFFVFKYNFPNSCIEEFIDSSIVSNVNKYSIISTSQYRAFGLQDTKNFSVTYSIEN